jgi:hypothetical protein
MQQVPEVVANHVDHLDIDPGNKQVLHYRCVDSACEVEINTHRKWWIKF